MGGVRREIQVRQSIVEGFVAARRKAIEIACEKGAVVLEKSCLGAGWGQ